MNSYCSVHGMDRNACRCSYYDQPPPLKLNFNLGWLVLIVLIGLGMFIK